MPSIKRRRTRFVARRKQPCNSPAIGFRIPSCPMPDAQELSSCKLHKPSGVCSERYHPQSAEVPIWEIVIAPWFPMSSAKRNTLRLFKRILLVSLLYGASVIATPFHFAIIQKAPHLFSISMLQATEVCYVRPASAINSSACNSRDVSC